MKTAVLLITFNRLDCVKEVLAAISKAKPPRLYIASDGPRQQKDGEKAKVEDIRQYLLNHIDWDCEIKTRFLEVNSGGCKYGVSGAVTWFFSQEPEGIILEDDCVPDVTFFSFCEKLLDKYRDNKKVWHIAGDAPIDVDIPESYYFAKIQHCWGWASWADRWKYFSLDVSQYGEEVITKFSSSPKVQKYWRNIQKKLNNNKIDTWDYQWGFHIVANDGLCINPAHCLVSNIGEDGVHYKNGGDELNRKTVPVKTIIHPQKMTINEQFVEKIYIERYKIKPVFVRKYMLFNIFPFLIIKEK